MANKQIPGFFKPFVAADCSERLRIPMTFAAYIEGMLPRRAFLRNPYGDIWPVAITRNESTGQCTFEGGWKEFVEQNKLEYGDFIIFKYDGGELFDFKLYEKSEAEKEYMRLSRVIPEPEEVKHQQVEQEQQQPQGLELELVEHQDKELAPEMEPEAEPEPQPEADSQAEVELEYSSKELEDLDKEDSEFSFEIEEVSSSRKKKIRRKRATSIKEVDENALFESGDITRPTNPYFVCQRRSDRNLLYVPTDVMRDFSNKLPKDLSISILDERDRKWAAKVNMWKDGRVWLTKGWKSFCIWNNVKPIDKCVCEFIPATDEHDILLKVRVIREAALRRPPRSS